MRALGSETVTLIAPTETTDATFNNTVITYNPTTGVDVTQCNVQPFLIAEKLQFEVDAERGFARSTWRVWLPVNATTLAIQPDYRLVWRGATYEVYGHTGIWNRLNGAQRHIQLVMQLRSG